MIDRELLELAAKAAGWKVVREACELIAGVEGVMLEGIQRPWSPLTNDGDALRLAVRLELDVFFSAAYVRACNRASDRPLPETVDGSDPYAATRRAIVRAAAEIGRTMK